MGNQREAEQSDGIPSYLPPKSVSFIALSKFTVKITRCGLQTIQEPKPSQAHAISPHIQPVFCVSFKFFFLHLINSFLPLTFMPFHLCKRYSLLIIAQLRSVFHPLYLFSHQLFL